MKGILNWCQSQLETKKTEENSGLGPAMKYFIKHDQGLTEFCRTEGAALDNNKMEAELKLIVRDRKNSFFRKSQNGADTADIVTSLLATMSWSGNNSFTYLNLLQRDRIKVREYPERYLPWNFALQL